MSDAQTGNQAYVEQCRENAQHLEAEIEALRTGYWENDRRVYKDFFAHATVIRQLFKDIKMLLHKDRERMWQEFQALAAETKQQQQDEWQEATAQSRQKRAIVEAKIEEAHYATIYAQTIQDLKIPADLLDQALDYMKNSGSVFDAAASPVPVAPVVAAPVVAAPVVAAPAEATPVEDALVEDAPVVEAPVEEAPVEDTPAVDAPVEDALVEDAPVVEAPVEEAPVEDTPAVDAPVEDALVEDAPVVEAPVEEAPVADVLVEDAPVVDTPVVDAPVMRDELPRPPVTVGGPMRKEDHDACWKYMQQVKLELRKRREAFWKVQFDSMKVEAGGAMSLATDGNPHDAQRRVQEVQQNLKNCSLAKWQFDEIQGFLRQAWEKARLRIEEQKRQRQDQYREFVQRQEEHMARWADQIGDCEGLIERIEMEIERLHDLESGGRSKDFIERVRVWIDEKNAKIAGIRKNIRTLEAKIESVKHRLKARPGDAISAREPERQPEQGPGAREHEPATREHEPAKEGKKRKRKRTRRKEPGARNQKPEGPELEDSGQVPKDLEAEAANTELAAEIEMPVPAETGEPARAMDSETPEPDVPEIPIFQEQSVRHEPVPEEEIPVPEVQIHEPEIQHQESEQDMPERSDDPPIDPTGGSPEPEILQEEVEKYEPVAESEVPGPQAKGREPEIPLEENDSIIK